MSAIRTICKRELRSYFLSPVAYVFLVSFLLLTAFFTFMLGGYFQRAQASLFSFFLWHPWLFMLLVPAVGMRLWAEEQKQGTLELLLTMPITIPQAVLGKFLAGWIFLALALTLTFPVIITTFYLGKPDCGPIITGYVGSILMAGAYLALANLTSACTRNQVISFIASLLLCLLLILVGFPPVVNLLLSWKIPETIANFAAGLSVYQHFYSMQRGVLDLRDVTYFLSIIVFALFATGIILKNKRR